jgi:hypothetical protein
MTVVQYSLADTARIKQDAEKSVSVVLAEHCRLTVSAAFTIVTRVIPRVVNLRHWALTDSHPSANVTLIILRVADLTAAAPGTRRALRAGAGRVRRSPF